MQFYLFLSSELLLSNNAKFSFSPGFPNSRKDYDADSVTLLQGHDVIGPSAIPSWPFEACSEVVHLLQPWAFLPEGHLPSVHGLTFIS